MSYRFLSFVSLSALIVLGLVFWSPPRNDVPALPATQKTDFAEDSGVAISSTSNVPTSSVTPPSNLPPVAHLQIEAVTELQWEKVINGKNIPVNIFGMVIDQDRQPISGVGLTMKVRHSEYLMSQGIVSKYPELETMTDSEGRFSWKSESGDVVTVETIAKSGYLLYPNSPRNFAPSSGSPNDPIVFRMWKQGPKELLVKGNHVFGLIPDGRPYTLDLLQSKKKEGLSDGDLRVSITRPVGVQQRDKYPWAFSIEAVEGGLVEANDELLYLAPDSGYESKIDARMDPTDAMWAQFVKRQFFIRSRNGQVYGRIEVQVDAIFNDHGAIEINYAVNPGASRNLQP